MISRLEDQLRRLIWDGIREILGQTQDLVAAAAKQVVVDLLSDERFLNQVARSMATRLSDPEFQAELIAEFLTRDLEISDREKLENYLTLLNLARELIMKILDRIFQALHRALESRAKA